MFLQLIINMILSWLLWEYTVMGAPSLLKENHDSILSLQNTQSYIELKTMKESEGSANGIAYTNNLLPCVDSSAFCVGTKDSTRASV